MNLFYVTVSYHGVVVERHARIEAKTGHGAAEQVRKTLQGPIRMFGQIAVKAVRS